MDWAATYKQIAVHPEDLHLQWFEWLGKYFCELSLIFGAVSSAGIFDRLAKIILFVVLQRSKFPSNMVSQHLDDCCAAAPAKDPIIYAFDNEYIAVAAELNIKLAPREDKEKSFGPTTEGCVYGINYDTNQQTWWMGEDRISQMQGQMIEVMDGAELAASKLWSLTGKILHMKDLITGGRFHLFHILKANSIYTDKKDSNKLITISNALKK